MGKITAIAVVTLKEGIREKAFSAALIFASLMLLGSGVVANLSIGNILKVTQDIGLSVLSLLGLFMVLFLGTHLVAKDLDRKSIYLVISKPVSRWQYIIGKFWGLFSLTGLTLFGAFLIFIIFLLYLRKTTDLYGCPQVYWSRIFLAFGFLLLKMAIIIAISIFFSSFASSSLVSFFLTFVIYFIGSSTQNVKIIMTTSLHQRFSEGLKLIFKVAYYVFPNLSLFDLKTFAVYNLSVNLGTLILSVLYALVYVFSLLAIAGFIFERRELT